MANTEKPKKAKAKSIVDVAPPGQSAPSPNSKSIILNNRPVLRDPMVVDDKAKDAEAGPPAGVSAKLGSGSSKGSKLQPLTAPTLKTADEPDQATAPPSPTKPDDEKEQPAKPKEPKPTTQELPQPPADAAAAVSDAKPAADAAVERNETRPQPVTNNEEEASSATTGSPEKIEEEAARQAKHEAAVEKLVDSKQYYLSINAIEKRRSRRVVTLGIILSLLLVIVWLDIALDAGLIRLGGIKPFTHFFSS